MTTYLTDHCPPPPPENIIKLITILKVGPLLIFLLSKTYKHIVLFLISSIITWEEGVKIQLMFLISVSLISYRNWHLCPTKSNYFIFLTHCILHTKIDREWRVPDRVNRFDAGPLKSKHHKEVSSIPNFVVKETGKLSNKNNSLFWKKMFHTNFLNF